MDIVHVGVLVEDLDAAIEAHRRLGLTFVEPRTIHIDRLAAADGGEEELDLRITFSHQGPPHVELCEATGTGLYGPQQIGGIHHVAVRVPDIDAARDEMLAQGAHAPASMYAADGALFLAYVQHGAGAGPVIELVSPDVHEGVVSWIAEG